MTDDTNDTADDAGLIRTDPDRGDVVVRREWDDKLIDAGTYSDSDSSGTTAGGRSPTGRSR